MRYTRKQANKQVLVRTKKRIMASSSRALFVAANLITAASQLTCLSRCAALLLLLLLICAACQSAKTQPAHCRLRLACGQTIDAQLAASAHSELAWRLSKPLQLDCVCARARGRNQNHK